MGEKHKTGKKPRRGQGIVAKVRVGNMVHQIRRVANEDIEGGRIFEHVIRPRRKGRGKSKGAKNYPGLKPLKPGEKGRNPWGAKGKSGLGGGGYRTIGIILKALATAPCRDPNFVKKYGENVPYSEAIALTTLDAAVRADHYAREFFADRTEGKVVQKLKLEDGKIRVTVNGIEQVSAGADIAEKVVPATDESERNNADA